MAAVQYDNRHQPAGDRQASLLDRCLAELDRGLRVISSSAAATRPSPAAGMASADLGIEEQQHAAALMRVNHAGEVAAQALYRGQAFTSRDPHLRGSLLRAAEDEYDHLAWCETRVHELGGRTSFLGPLWYAGSFALGAAAGLAPKATGLGFVVETERQVGQHLASHLDRLPEGDAASRRIVEQMCIDEAGHGSVARELGGTDLPGPLRKAMSLLARVMTTVAHRV